MFTILMFSINMKLRRVGGGYGSKLTRSSMVAAACAVASKLLNKPVRLVLSLETNMAAIGKRYPCYTEYQVSAKILSFSGITVQLINILEINTIYGIGEKETILTLMLLPKDIIKLKVPSKLLIKNNNNFT